MRARRCRGVRGSPPVPLYYREPLRGQLFGRPVARGIRIGLRDVSGSIAVRLCRERRAVQPTPMVGRSTVHSRLRSTRGLAPLCVLFEARQSFPVRLVAADFPPAFMSVSLLSGGRVPWAFGAACCRKGGRVRCRRAAWRRTLQSLCLFDLAVARFFDAIELCLEVHLNHERAELVTGAKLQGV